MLDNTWETLAGLWKCILDSCPCPGISCHTVPNLHTVVHTGTDNVESIEVRGRSRIWSGGAQRSFDPRGARAPRGTPDPLVEVELVEDSRIWTSIIICRIWLLASVLEITQSSDRQSCCVREHRQCRCVQVHPISVHALHSSDAGPHLGIKVFNW